MSFFKRVKLSIFNVEKYQDFALENFDVAVKYFGKLVLIIAIVFSMVATYKFTMVYNLLTSNIENVMPEFTFSNNALITESKVNELLVDGNISMRVIVDTEADEETINAYKAQLNEDKSGIIFLKDSVVIQFGNLITQTSGTYSSLINKESDLEITKASLIDEVNNMQFTSLLVSFLLSMILYMFISYVLVMAFEALFVAIIGLITSLIVKVKIKFSKIYAMSLYSMTLSAVLNLIYTSCKTMFGFNLEYFSILYTVIPYIYIITAIMITRSDLVKQQVEIGKIKKVEEEVKEELKKEKEKNEEQEKNNESNEKKNGKKEKKTIDNKNELDGAEA